MRQRITFIQEPQNSLDPALLEVTNNFISTPSLYAAREDRVTFGLEELPQELYRVLKASHELHIRWVSQEPYVSIAPLVARLSPGLHVFYTPQRGSNNSAFLCPTLKKVFGEMDCRSPERSFTPLPNERFSLSAASQYYTPLPALSSLITYATHRLCSSKLQKCISRMQSFSHASTLDVDFDTISHALTITAFWAASIQSFHIGGMTHRDRLEVGVLSINQATEPEELSLGGFLTVVGEDKKPKATMFSFPARHHPFASSFAARWLQSTGLHPVLGLEIDDSTRPTDERACSLHTHLTLPRTVFADKYQLSDSLVLASKNLSAIHYSTPAVDLEAPAYTLKTWGSSVLLELAPPSSPGESFTAQIPLHLRFLPPSNGTAGIAKIELPYPVVFWACVADEGSKFPINPFDKVNLGYDGLFGPKTMFYHLIPQGEKLVNTINVPVLDLDQSRYVEMGTAATVVLGFGWVLWCLLGVWKRNGYGSNSNKEREKVVVVDKKEQ
ncbi:PIG-X [Calycina marina]|uniref:Protein PBN1 n=1 Tax=Calycina marina TaxID=1763456 RepID=A0A9P7Z7V6_9HELO|nr:PIG-X [Calycina marina]